MTVKDLIKELVNYDMDQEVEICCYPLMGDSNEMEIYENTVDKNGNTACKVRMKISYTSMDMEGKTVFIS